MPLLLKKITSRKELDDILAMDKEAYRKLWKLNDEDPNNPEFARIFAERETISTDREFQEKEWERKPLYYIDNTRV